MTWTASLGPGIAFDFPSLEPISYHSRSCYINQHHFLVTTTIYMHRRQVPCQSRQWAKVRIEAYLAAIASLTGSGPLRALRPDLSRKVIIRMLGQLSWWLIGVIMLVIGLTFWAAIVGRGNGEFHGKCRRKSLAKLGRPRGRGSRTRGNDGSPCAPIARLLRDGTRSFRERIRIMLFGEWRLSFVRMGNLLKES